MEEDQCGICGGDGTKCQFKNRVFKGEVSKGDLVKKLIVLPQGARSIRVHFKQGNVRS